MPNTNRAPGKPERGFVFNTSESASQNLYLCFSALANSNYKFSSVPSVICDATQQLNVKQNIHRPTRAQKSKKMKKALVVIDIQNDITKNYKEIIGNINKVIDWAVCNNIHVVYIRHENLSDGTRTFKPNTLGAELVPDMKTVSKNIFTKYRGNALTSEEFAEFINKNGIDEFYVAGADAIACIKSTCYNMAKENYKVNVLSDCITSSDKRKIDEMLRYYESKGCKLITLNDLV